MKIEGCTDADGQGLAELRARSMKPSLLAVGRFDEDRVRTRFLNSFVPEDTKKIVLDNKLCGFFVVKRNPEHLYLDHLYIEPALQNRGIGRFVMDSVLQTAQQENLPVRLGALRESRANQFYQKLGFVQTHEDAYDIYYEYEPGGKCSE